MDRSASGIITHKVKRVILCGGGRVSYYLAKLLENSGIAVQIIEREEDRCRQLAALLPKACLIHGDASQDSLLQFQALQRFSAVPGGFIRQKFHGLRLTVRNGVHCQSGPGLILHHQALRRTFEEPEIEEGSPGGEHRQGRQAGHPSHRLIIMAGTIKTASTTRILPMNLPIILKFISGPYSPALPSPKAF